MYVESSILCCSELRQLPPSCIHSFSTLGCIPPTCLNRYLKPSCIITTRFTSEYPNFLFFYVALLFHFYHSFQIPNLKVFIFHNDFICCSYLSTRRVASIDIHKSEIHNSSEPILWMFAFHLPILIRYTYKYIVLTTYYINEPSGHAEYNTYTSISSQSKRHSIFFFLLFLCEWLQKLTYITQEEISSD